MDDMKKWMLYKISEEEPIEIATLIKSVKNGFSGEDIFVFLLGLIISDKKVILYLDKDDIPRLKRGEMSTEQLLNIGSVIDKAKDWLLNEEL